MVNSFQNQVFKEILNILGIYGTANLRMIEKGELEEILKNEHNQWNVFRDDLKTGFNLVNEIAVEQLYGNGVRLFVHYVQFKTGIDMFDRNALESIMQFLVTDDYRNVPIVNVVRTSEGAIFKQGSIQEYTRDSATDADTFNDTMCRTADKQVPKRYQHLKK